MECEVVEEKGTRKRGRIFLFVRTDSLHSQGVGWTAEVRMEFAQQSFPRDQPKAVPCQKIQTTVFFFLFVSMNSLNNGRYYFLTDRTSRLLQPLLQQFHRSTGCRSRILFRRVRLILEFGYH